MMMMMMMMLQMLIEWYCVMMLSAVNCALVVAPDVSSDNDRKIAHISALQGTHINRFPRDIFHC